MKNEKIFITGCGGMLGNGVYPFFKSWYENVLATDKNVNEEWLSYLDVRDTSALQKVFAEYKPDIVLHLAAETDLEFCETHPETAQATNSDASKTIAQLCEENDTTLVYISTAGIFDGKKTGYYTEQDAPNPIMVYGRTKYEGEVHTLKYCSKSYVIRAGWMMGGGRKKEKKFIYKIIQQIGQGKTEIFAVDDKWGTPTYTYDFAMNLFLLLETGKYGTYHMVCEGKGTRYDVAEEILRICERPDIKLTRVSSDFFEQEYFAPRPYSEMMRNDNLSALGINHMRPWRDAVRDYIETHFIDFIEDTAGRSAVRPDKASAPEDPRRKSVRTNYISTVRYVNGGGDQIKRAIGVNFSNSEMCLYMFSQQEKGQTIEIFNEDARKTGSGTKATIQWVNKEECGLYKASVKLHLDQV